MLVAENQADLIVRLEEASFHPRVIKYLGCSFDCKGLRKGAKHMQGLSHDQDLLTTEGFLEVWSPSIEHVCSVWEQDAFVFSFGLLNDLEELRSNLRRGWDTSIGWASEDQENILTFFNCYILLFIAVATTSCHWWEYAFIICLSATVEDADDETVVHFA